MFFSNFSKFQQKLENSKACKVTPYYVHTMIIMGFVSREGLKSMIWGWNLVTFQKKKKFRCFQMFFVVFSWNLQDSPNNREYSFLSRHMPGPISWPLKLLTNSNWEYTLSFIQIDLEVCKNNTYIFCAISTKNTYR